jgi:hypothetical protein
MVLFLRDEKTREKVTGIGKRFWNIAKRSHWMKTKATGYQLYFSTFGNFSTFFAKTKIIPFFTTPLALGSVGKRIAGETLAAQELAVDKEEFYVFAKVL